MKIPKIVPVLTLAVLISVPSTLPLRAAESTTSPDIAGEKVKPGKKGQKHGKARAGGKKKRHQKRDPWKKLDLTDAQKEQVKAIRESRAPEMAAIRSEAKEKSQFIRAEIEKEVRAILTPEQTAKLDEMKEKRAAKKKAE